MRSTLASNAPKMPNDFTCPSIPSKAIDAAAQHTADILSGAFEHAPATPAIVVWDADCDLSIALAQAYRRSLPGATFVQFNAEDPESVRAVFDPLGPGDLVVLVQSTSFRLAAFRIRLELFRRSIKVIEHPHLSRMAGSEALVYLDALAYDRRYYRGVGAALKVRLDKAEVGIVHSGGDQLHFPVGFDVAKLNVGDYRGMTNTGGQYPIGEVFTESSDLEAVHGRVHIAIFGDRSYTINTPPVPIVLIVEKGRVVGTENSTPEFDAVLDSIRADEGQVWMRELGLGMNRAFTFERTVSDVGSFERMCGVHLSLGAKHVMYNKPNIKKKLARQHVDVFVATESVNLDGERIFKDGAWLVGGD